MNYVSSTRTNYFRVKDHQAFENLMRSVAASEGRVDVWKRNPNNSKALKDTLYGFGCESSIIGVPVSGWRETPDENGDFDCEDYNYDLFADRLCKLVADDDAIIIMESGAEGLRYLVGAATVITSKGWEYLDLAGLAIECASKKIGNPVWRTDMSY